jgi:alcohol dehydrogenase class IV
MITLEEHRRKGVFISKALVPDVALVDPEPLTTAPPIHALASGLDALTHAFEALVSNARSDLTDALALHAVPLIARGLPAMHSAPTDVPTLTCLMKGSLAAGLAFSNASLGAAHALAHAVGGITDGSHGLLCGMLLEPVAAFNYQAEPERHDQFARALGVDVDGLPPGRRKEGLRSGLRALRETVGLEGSLRDLGVRPADVPDLAARAARDPCLVTNPRPAGRRDLEVILEEAL